MKWASLETIREQISSQYEVERRPDNAAGPLFQPYVWREPRLIPKREWLYGGHFIRKFLTGTFAPGAGGKSMLELVEAMAMASGKPLLGVMPTQRLRVGYWNGEDPLEETERRVAAATMHFGLTREDLDGWLFWGSGRDSDLVIAEQTKDGTTIIRPNVDRLLAELQAAQLDVAIIDPFVSSHRVTENDNNAINAVAKEWASVADIANCAVEVVHHTVKAAIGREVRVEDGRGGGALLFATRSARVLNTMSDEEADAAGVDPRTRRYYFRVDNGKANLAPPPNRSAWFRFVGVDLGNGDGLHPGDNVGVVTPWAWPADVEQPKADTTGKPKSGGRGVKLNHAGQTIMAAFGRLMDDGRTTPVPHFPGVEPGTRGVLDGELRKMATRLGLFPNPKPDGLDKRALATWQSGARTAWQRGVGEVTTKGLLRFEDGFIWQLRAGTTERKSEERVTSRDDDEW